ncbi:precorrin-6y C5,15-methyltransferase (decarboxylating) subunit CbiE [Cupriavidus sp. BIC8F]|uniref:precorrin-6y C5,15-methyltransferase (decarboxylating) subunit CbiE n=1 Tax=Cupriavidus sp. BIC8F TaxID=3079014 RepID=UPI002916C4F6|nr:precorrin-6y C5,15-methyltransferase (decarboxylating) subunit CbiE [Cupriavidus sp. BIC8F]
MNKSDLENEPRTAWLTVVGIGDDGFAGLGRAARRALLAAHTIYGGARHLAMLPRRIGAQREAWPSPFSIEPVLARRGSPVCVVASGDPMLFGVGATLARAVPAGEINVIPYPSSISFAAARLGWALHEVSLVSLVGRPLPALQPALHDGARVLVLSAGCSTPAELATWLTAQGYGPSRMTVFEHLGGERERCVHNSARAWNAPDVAALNLVAIECRAGREAMRLPVTPGLPDEAYLHDGQLTKHDVRALTLSRLAPVPGELLWDVGAGCGSIGIEWMRAHPTCRAIAIESHAERQRFIRHNRDALGVPGLQLIERRAPEALRGLDTPDAVFIGGGLTVPGVLETCWDRLRGGGRLVANAVTVQGEAVLAAWRESHGGALTRISLAEAQPLGRFDTWRSVLPITMLVANKAEQA